MKGYENPEIPEGINVTPEHPLKEFAQLVAGFSVLLLVLALGLAELGAYAARHLTVEQERALADTLASGVLPDGPAGEQARLEQARLQAMADRLVRHMPMPVGLAPTVHYSPEPVVNAMATLGGHIVIYQGLLDATKGQEVTLAMVLAHELAHVQLRHPATALGRGFAVAVLLGSVAGLGDRVIQGWANTVGTLTALQYSREQEKAADAAALMAVYREYGTVEGADGFFEHLSTQDRWLDPPALLSTHPGHEDRIRMIRAFAESHPSTRSTTQ